MVKLLLQRENKKGISIMVGYVLLIVIAVGLSVAVFSFLKLYLPSEEPQCPNDIILTIEHISCENMKVNISLSNRGLFNANGVFIRIGDRDRVFKDLLSDEEIIFVPILEPGKDWSNIFDYSSTGVKEVEIEPFVYIENRPVLCDSSVISQTVNCG